jgi:hypothetical protein
MIDELLVAIAPADAALIGATLQFLAHRQRGHVHDSACDRMQRVGRALSDAAAKVVRAAGVVNPQRTP